MLTSEFKEELEDLGYKTTKMQAMGDCLLVVAGSGMSIPLVVISNRAKNSFSTNEMSEISDDLFDLVVEYASTTIEEREEAEVEGDVFLVTYKDIQGETVAITTDESGDYILVSEWSEEIPALTEEQVDALPEKYQPMNGFVKARKLN